MSRFCSFDLPGGEGLAFLSLFLSIWELNILKGKGRERKENRTWIRFSGWVTFNVLLYMMFVDDFWVGGGGVYHGYVHVYESARHDPFFSTPSLFLSVSLSLSLYICTSTCLYVSYISMYVCTLCMYDTRSHHTHTERERERCAFSMYRQINKRMNI